MKRSEWDELAKYLWKLSTMKSKHSQPIKDLIAIVYQNIFYQQEIHEVILDDNEQTSKTIRNDTRLDPNGENASY